MISLTKEQIQYILVNLSNEVEAYILDVEEIPSDNPTEEHWVRLEAYIYKYDPRYVRLATSTMLHSKGVMTSVKEHNSLAFSQSTVVHSKDFERINEIKEVVINNLFLTFLRNRLNVFETN